MRLFKVLNIFPFVFYFKEYELLEEKNSLVKNKNGYNLKCLIMFWLGEEVPLFTYVRVGCFAREKHLYSNAIQLWD